MRIILAYTSVILLWSTTPLAIKWSSEGSGSLFGVTSRMAIGTVCVLIWLLSTKQPLPMHRKAKMTYFAVALQIYGAMLAVYWAAQLIPTGWISLIFGLTPIITALMAAIALKDQKLTVAKMFAYSLAIFGMWIMFGTALQYSDKALFGIASVLFSVTLHCASAVWIKQIDAKIPAISQVTGGLLIALPAYLLTWTIADGQWPANIPMVSLAAIFYLGIVATSFGFALYYYLLKHLQAGQVALINLVTPVLALIIGHRINQEPLTTDISIGAGLILSSLIFHEFFDRISKRKLIRKNL
ncbi:EamA family transporter [Methylosoma difficile]